MSKSILPSGEPLELTPEEILRYVNPDALRQIFRQERLRWNLKPNKDAEYFSNATLYKYSGDFHNAVLYQRGEIRTFPDNGSYPGYAGWNNDTGEFGLVHNVEKWDYAFSDESLKEIINRAQWGAMARVGQKLGYGLDDEGRIVKETPNRMAQLIADPFDGRIYYLSNDDPIYVNNEKRQAGTRLPLRTVARIGDIPTRIADLVNDLNFVSDPDYKHTDNNFTNSHRFLVENMDDRTFVYPEISKDKSGDYVSNRRIGLHGDPDYAESDGQHRYNSQPDLGENPDLGDYGDRFGELISSYNINKNFSGVTHEAGYFPGVFRSIEELERVDLVDQLRQPLTHAGAPGGRRSHNYYLFDGVWSPTWFDRFQYKDSYLAQSLHPLNMEIHLPEREPVPFGQLDQEGEKYATTKLYQWRYNRISLKYHSKDVKITILDAGEEYEVGDILRWSFGDEPLLYKVTQVGPNGQIMTGSFVDHIKERIFLQDPSTHGVGIPFTNMGSVGRGALLAVYCRVTISTHASQIKNNLYAYVDVVPTVRSDNQTIWSDINSPDTQEGLVNVRSTASFPAYSGVNSGRGGPGPTPATKTRFHEHGGNATAGVQVHLFRYVINTQNPTWVIRNGIQIFTGRWVDQGPMGVERPCDIKALFLSNPDTNNFNNYYKFMLDVLFEQMTKLADSVMTNNPNALGQPLYHKAQRDPQPDQRFYMEIIDPDTSRIKEVDVTDRVFYINEATGVLFLYNPCHKSDPMYGYANRAPGWYAFAGAITR